MNNLCYYISNVTMWFKVWSQIIIIPPHINWVVNGHVQQFDLPLDHNSRFQKLRLYTGKEFDDCIVMIPIFSSFPPIVRPNFDVGLKFHLNYNGVLHLFVSKAEFFVYFHQHQNKRNIRWMFQSMMTTIRTIIRFCGCALFRISTILCETLTSNLNKWATPNKIVTASTVARHYWNSMWH